MIVKHGHVYAVHFTLCGALGITLIWQLPGNPVLAFQTKALQVLVQITGLAFVHMFVSDSYGPYFCASLCLCSGLWQRS